MSQNEVVGSPSQVPSPESFRVGVFPLVLSSSLDLEVNPWLSPFAPLKY